MFSTYSKHLGMFCDQEEEEEKPQQMQLLLRIPAWTLSGRRCSCSFLFFKPDCLWLVYTTTGARKSKWSAWMRQTERSTSNYLPNSTTNNSEQHLCTYLNPWWQLRNEPVGNRSSAGWWFFRRRRHRWRCVSGRWARSPPHPWRSECSPAPRSACLQRCGGVNRPLHDSSSSHQIFFQISLFPSGREARHQ